MAGEFWLSEAQWGAIEPLLAEEPARGPQSRRSTRPQRHRPCFEDRLSLAGLPCRLRSADDGLQSLSPLDDARAYGGGCLKPWRAPNPAMVKPSTARQPRRTVRRRAEKGGRGAGDWSLARRPHDENPRHRRRARTPHRHRSDARPSRRRSGCDSPDQRCSARAGAWPPTQPMTAMGCVASCASAARSRSSRTTQPGKDIIPSTRLPIASAISSNACSAASRIGDASPPATTSSQPTSPPP